MGWSLRSLFWNDYQKALKNPADYDKPIKAAEIAAELEMERDYESRTLMQSSLTDGTNPRGEISIARIVEQIDSMEQAMRREFDRALLEFGRDAKLGSSLLAHRLVARANRLAMAIQPGAKEKLRWSLG